MKTKERNRKINFLTNGSFIQRFFTKTNVHPYDEVKWIKTKAEIPGSDFKMEDVEFPDFYSQNAINIIASKYFKINRGKQEKSLKEIIDRVVKTFKKWGLEQGYFDEKYAEIYEKELTYIILHQYATFNSPVWFNVGVEGRSQQCSACQPYRSLVSTPFGFIPIGKIVEERLVGLPVYDSKGVTFVTGVKENGFKEVYKIYLKNGLYIEATGDHLVKASDVYDRDGNKFKWLRVDELKPGMRLYVHFHNVFSEKTYPAEKNVDANQIIYCQSANSSVLTKSKIEIRYSNLQKLIDEAALAGWLQGDGFVGKYSSGTNKSWIIEFMAVNEEQLNYLLPKIEKVFEGVHYRIRETFTKTGRRIWRIRLYGNQLKNFIEKYDLVKRKENMQVPQILFGAPKEAVVSYLRSFFDCEGYVSFRKDVKHNYENSRIGAATISKNLMEDVLILLIGLGIYAKLYRQKEKRQNRQDAYCISITYGNSKKLFAELIGFISKEKIEKLNVILNEFKHKNHNPFRNEEIVKIEKLGVEKVYDIQTLSGEYLSNNVAIHNCFILNVEDNMESILDWIKIEGMVFKGGSGSGVNLSKLRAKGEKLSTGGSSSGVISFMRAADAVAGSIKSGGSTRRAAKMVILNADHPEIMDFIRVKAEEENKVRALMEAGYDMTDMNNPLWQNIFFQNANNSVRIPDALMEAAIKDGEWKTYYRTTGGVAKVYKAKDILWEIAKAAWECGDPGVQFDDIIQKWHTCKNSGKIEATNPCSEFVFLNWNSCNLASINLLKFLKEDGSFDVPAFMHTARVMFLSQDLLISKADYPHPKIAEETKKYRTIGLGYTNLGALIMALGLPYDSEEARDLAASITALMTGTAYKLSAEIAGKLGPFPEYEKNKEPMMEVMKMHKDHLKKVKENEFNKEILEKAKEAWNEVIELGEKYGFRNAQSVVIAPTGTISFFMDADTTGIEPDFALVKMKQLVGGGYMKIVNKTVPLALKRLGYSEEQIKDIIKHLEETQNIETAPHIKEEHLSVFDCAIKPPGGKRYIHWMGHVKMVAAVQPFISGGISKTFNMPNETTIQEIYDAYFTAWKLGIKCFAVYRDGSKATQALYTEKKEKKLKERMERRRLPLVRQSETHKFSVAGHEGYLTYSMFEDGSLGEIFIRMSKQGSTLAGLLDAFAIAVSIALQYGVPLKELANKFIYMRFEPMGITNNEDIPIASSIVDYIFKYLALRFLTPEELKEIGLEVKEKAILKEHPKLIATNLTLVKENNNLARLDSGRLVGPPCKYCGGMTTRTGSCYTCLECGESSGGCG
jgi:ribonucleoside-diphosphate reductase alpha chain